MKQAKWSPMRWLHSVRAWVVALLAGCFLALGTGCYGSFPLTHLVYSANGRIQPPVVRQVVFWVFLILPVYEISALGDVVIMNLLEFWTDTDFEGFEYSGKAGELKFAMRRGEDGETANVTVSRRGEPVARAQFMRVSDELCEVRSPEGDLLGSAVRTSDGSVRLEAADGAMITTVSGERLDDLMASTR